MAPIPGDHPLRRWFSGLVENSFQTELGICDPMVLDYLVELLTEFIHIERISLLPDGSGRSIEDVAGLLVEKELFGPTAEDERQRTLHRHIGDFTLFWTGVYPENLRRLRRRESADSLLSYFKQGKRSYAIASRLSDDRSAPPAGVFRSLSDQFESCVYGLGLVRKEWERASPGGHDSFRFLLQ